MPSDGPGGALDAGSASCAPIEPATPAGVVRLQGQGSVRGLLHNDVLVYRGIRYAKAPFGDLRFKAPEPTQAWEGILDAFDFAPASPQAARSLHAQFHGGADCLALNIWRPTRPAAPCPVMVWIPGGAYMRGDATDRIYDGAAFARQGIVFVSLNYRVGIDGFLQIPGAPANRGLLDQIAALQWIFQHIESFGGDPSQITVAGGSAGAGAIACLMGVPEVEGLFRRAILQSPSVATHSLEDAEIAATAVADLVGRRLHRDGLRDLSIADTVQVMKMLAEDEDLRRRYGFKSRNYFPIRAVVDGELLKKPPLELARQRHARAQEFALLVGSNRDEMRLYAVSTGNIHRTTSVQLRQFANEIGVGCEDLERYALERGLQHPGEILCALQSDYFYRNPARALAQQFADSGASAYLYEFMWKSPRFDGQLGAAHGLEIPFVFDKLRASEGVEITGREAPQNLADQMHGAWVQFVRTGQPGWPRHSESGREVMHFDQTSSIARDAFEKVAYNYA